MRQAIVDASGIGAAIGLVFFLTSQLCGRCPACVGAVLLTGSASAFAVYTAKAVLPPGSAPGRTPAGVLLAVVTGHRHPRGASADQAGRPAAALDSEPASPREPGSAAAPGVHGHVRGLRRGAGRRFRGGRHQGLRHGLHVGIVVAAYNTAWPNHVLCITWSAVRRLLPWRFMRFLALLHAGEILRQEGPLYSFRAVELQNYLAATHAPARGRPIPRRQDDLPERRPGTGAPTCGRTSR